MDFCDRCGGLLCFVAAEDDFIFQCGTCGHRVGLPDHVIEALA